MLTKEELVAPQVALPGKPVLLVALASCLIISHIQS